MRGDADIDDRSNKKRFDHFYRPLRTTAGKFYRAGKRRIRSFLSDKSYRIRMTIRQIGVKNNQTKREEFDEFVTNHRVCFTTDLVKTGFTDQLFGFSLLYSLGRRMGLCYLHTPLSSHRSSRPFLFDPQSRVDHNKGELKSENGRDIFDTIGLNGYLTNISAKGSSQKMKRIQVNLDLIFKDRKVDDFNHLVDLLKALLRPFLNKKRKSLFIFKAKPGTYFRFFRELNEQDLKRPDFPDSYKKYSHLTTAKTLFQSDRPKVFVHIRQGDTATIKTPWDTYIPVWHSVEGKFKQFNKKSDIKQPRAIDTEEFFKVIKSFYDKDLPEPSIVLHSDGYKKAFRWIYKYSKRKHLSEEQLNRLMQNEKRYDEEKFSAFRKLPGLQTVIGEEAEKLHQLIVDFMHADILIVGTQQVMVPKMMRIYRTVENKPLLVILYKGAKPHLDYLGISKDDFLSVNVEDPDIKRLHSVVLTYLQKNYRISIDKRKIN